VLIPGNLHEINQNLNLSNSTLAMVQNTD